MASTRNAKLAKLAVGIVSAAALAGLAGRFSTNSVAQETAVRDADRWKKDGSGERWATAPWHEDEDDWWHDGEDEDHGKKHYGRHLVKPERRSGGAASPDAVPRTRTGRS